MSFKSCHTNDRHSLSRKHCVRNKDLDIRFLLLKLGPPPTDMLYSETMNRLQTGFLYAHPSFLSGLARVLDLFGVFDSYNRSRSPQEADAKAMYADWRIVGQDIMDAAERFEVDDVHRDSNEKQLPLFASH